ncbi:TPR_11 domain-containing protein [Cephalotus follicularis]|uniref:TPR_11 domain-containing protein n=1 Tax=Cephalotus follicularis TaxID=3775 RepID=A0A1Q3D6W5_CEPFO|nr:TPR_11 domain-containing protein [Cephalotus follicularis]
MKKRKCDTRRPLRNRSRQRESLDVCGGKGNPEVHWTCIEVGCTGCISNKQGSQIFTCCSYPPSFLTRISQSTQTKSRKKLSSKQSKMMLRSSSTPVLGSLLSSFSDTPNNNIHHEITNNPVKNNPPTSVHQNHHKVSFSFHLAKAFCNSSPISPSTAESHNSSIRRAQSDGNLEGLAHASCNKNVEEFYDTNQPNKFAARKKRFMLQTIPSFSIYNSRSGREYEEDEDGSEEAEESEELFDRKGSSGERVTATDGGGFGLENVMAHMVLSEEVKAKDGVWNVAFGEETSQEMHLARGLGIAHTSGGGGDHNPASSGGDVGDNHSVEQYFKRMMEENPGNPLFLRNYAQLLYQSKRDLEGAEDYYSRAILADPYDGEILTQYAKLVWELHHDQDRASSYFERAVQASPEDSHVHAAYANFLWETEEDDDECIVPSDVDYTMPPRFYEGAIASASA